MAAHHAALLQVLLRRERDGEGSGEALCSEYKEKENMSNFKASSCERCQFTDIIKNTNSFIESEIDPPNKDIPMHVNFT